MSESWQAQSPRRHSTAALALGLLFALVGCTAPDAPPAATPAPPPAPSPAVMEADADAALRRMATTLADARSFAVRVRTLREVRTEDGQSLLLGATSVVLARRPDRLFAAIGSDAGNVGLWYDGRRVTVLDPARNAFAHAPLSGDIVAAADWLEDGLGFALPIRPLLAADPYAAMLEAGQTSGRSIGQSLIGSRVVRHFAFRNPLADWEVWVDEGPRPLPRRVSVVERRGPAPVRMTAEFEDWDLAPRLPDRAFAFVAPRGATEVSLPPARGASVR